MIPMHYATFPLGGENLHDPLRRLMVAAEAEQLSDRVLAPREGEVVSAGSGTRSEDGAIIALDVRAGDTILFGKWSGTEVQIDGEDLIIMKESDVLGIIA